jgi:hypothetical protein
MYAMGSGILKCNLVVTSQFYDRCTLHTLHGSATRCLGSVGVREQLFGAESRP